MSQVRIAPRRLSGPNSGCTTSPPAPARRNGGCPQLKSQGKEIRIFGRLSEVAGLGRRSRRMAKAANRMARVRNRATVPAVREPVRRSCVVMAWIGRGRAGIRRWRPPRGGMGLAENSVVGNGAAFGGRRSRSAAVARTTGCTAGPVGGSGAERDCAGGPALVVTGLTAGRSSSDRGAVVEPAPEPLVAMPKMGCGAPEWVLDGLVAVPEVGCGGVLAWVVEPVLVTVPEVGCGGVLVWVAEPVLVAAPEGDSGVPKLGPGATPAHAVGAPSAELALRSAGGPASTSSAVLEAGSPGATCAATSAAPRPATASGPNAPGSEIGETSSPGPAAEPGASGGEPGLRAGRKDRVVVTSSIVGDRRWSAGPSGRVVHRRAELWTTPGSPKAARRGGPGGRG